MSATPAGHGAMAQPELQRRLANLVRIGRVFALDTTKRAVRVKSGDLETNWLNWMQSRAGDGVDWRPPKIGEQVVVLSIGGDTRQGIVIGSLYQDDFQPSSADPNVHRVEFSDGTVLEYDIANSKLSVSSVGDVDVQADGDVEVTCANLRAMVMGDVQVTCSGLSATVSGNASLSCMGLNVLAGGNVNATCGGTLTVTAALAIAVTSPVAVTITASQIICNGLLVPMMGLGAPAAAGGPVGPLRILSDVKIEGQSEATGAIIGPSASISGTVNANTVTAGTVTGTAEVTAGGVPLKAHKHNAPVGGGITGGPVP